ncbi:cell shape determining protein MreB/Mrl family [Clostridium sp. CAG:793]|nr:cell shape determining protein MreB/Mrl family [Clostridium sp. CAG:793]
MKLLDFSSKDIGIDLGTTNILITLKGKGIVLREPSVVAIDQVTSEIVATGKEAKEMLGRTPENIRAVRPMKDGVIADFTATGLMLKNMLRKVCQKYNVGKPRIVVGVPSGITEVEERAVQEAFLQAGAKEVYLLDEPMASAIGAGINVLEPNGKLIIDIGGGTTEVAVISLGGIVCSTSIKVAGNAIDEAIVDYLKKHENIVIGLAQAENLKIELGCAMPLVSEITKEIRGRDIDVGLPKNINISSKEIELAMQRPINEIIEAVINTLSVTPPELASDIMQNGIYLAGGGALIRNLDNLIAQRTGIKTYIADSPLECVAIGAGKTLENFEKMRPVIVNRKHWRA